ncbi:hypothetical protein EZS27_006654 [termite gut metagenome]|uniref:Uncharacterized protein n=1 Tax=termite gut metagenome TaxID=433724 RepID=A0A5J4SIK3_9ZZZZ
MKKWLFLFLPFLFAGCDTSNDDMPTIEIVKLYVNDEDINYRNKIDKLPDLTVGDELIIELDLRGKKVDLSRFLVQEGKELLPEERESGIFFSFAIGFNEEVISNTISKPEEGMLAFKDGIRRTNLEIKVTITDVVNEAAILFYLSSKGHAETVKTGISLKLSNSDTPTIKITELYLNNNEKNNYCDNSDDLPVLSFGDELYFNMKLYGNGYGLSSFLVYEKKEQLSIDIVPYDENVVSIPENIGKGILDFKNNVFRTSLVLKVNVKSTADVKTILTFELSSKSGFEGIKETVDLVLERE